MDLEAIVQELDALLGPNELFVEENLEERVEALSFLDFAEGLLETALRQARCRANSGDVALPEGRCFERLRQVRDLRHALRAADLRLFARARDLLLERSGGGRIAARALLDRFTGYRTGDTGYLHAGFEALDALCAGIFLEDPLPDLADAFDEEMIAYQPTPASVILELVDRVSFGSDDLFCDLGSGTGMAVFLVHLLSGTLARGIEIDPALFAYAVACSRRLGVEGVTFVQGDVRETDLRNGTVFYLFTPFVGAILDGVLRRLHAEARQREIRVCSYGPCTPTVASQPWLVALDHHGADEFRLALFTSRGGGS